MASLLEHLCAPYIEGDVVEVETSDGWTTASVLVIRRTTGRNTAFGLVWEGVVQVTSGACRRIVVNNDGRNASNARGVRPAPPEGMPHDDDWSWDDASGEDVLA